MELFRQQNCFCTKIFWFCQCFQNSITKPKNDFSTALKNIFKNYHIQKKFLTFAN